MGAKLERHAEQLSALGHPVRLKILRFVVQAGAQSSNETVSTTINVTVPAGIRVID